MSNQKKYISRKENNNWDAENVIIENIANPSNGLDAVNKNYCDSNSVKPGDKDIILPFGEYSKDYISFKKIYYETRREVIYRGSSIIGTPTNIKMLVSVRYSSRPCSFRLYDSINGNVVGELTSIANEEMQILNIGTIANIPTGEAILEVQGKSNTSRGELKLYCIILEF